MPSIGTINGWPIEYGFSSGELPALLEPLMLIFILLDPFWTSSPELNKVALNSFGEDLVGWYLQGPWFLYSFEMKVISNLCGYASRLGPALELP